MSTQDRKRPRTEIDTEASAKEAITRHPTLYFEDGNLLLKCHHTLFCVHRTLLSKHSTVFCDLIARNTVTLHGLACITTKDDADDMESLLKAFYDGMHVECTELTVETFPTLAGLLRISTKYNVQRPRAAILERLRAEWPSSLEKHDEKVAGLAQDLRQKQHQAGAAFEDLIVHPASVIALLRDCDYSGADLLAPLFYDLSTRVWQFGEPITGHHIAPLSPADTERLVVGLNALRSFQMVYCVCPLTYILHPGGADAPQTTLCISELIGLWHNVVGRKITLQQNSPTAQCNPIEHWKAIAVGIRAEAGPVVRAARLCQACANKFPVCVEWIRESMWQSMANFFKLT